MHIQDVEGPMASQLGCQTHIHIHFQASALLQQDHLTKKRKNEKNEIVAQATNWGESILQRAKRSGVHI